MNLVIEKKRIPTYLFGVIFVFSFLNIVEFAGISLLTVATALFCLLVGIDTLCSKRTLGKKKSLDILIPIILVAIAWLSVLWSNDPSISISRNYAYTILPIYYLMTQLKVFDEQDIDIIDKYIVFGGLCYIIFAFASQGISGIMSGRFATVSGMDQNATCANVFLMLIGLFHYLKRHKKTVFHIIQAVFLLWLFLMTGSRGGLFAIVIFTCVVFMNVIPKKRVKFIIIGTLLIVICLTMAPFILPENIYLRLFTTSSYEATITSEKNRVAIWKCCFERVIPNMNFYGVGTGIPPYLIGGYFGFAARGIHNTYLCMFMETGILMLPLFAIMLYRQIKASAKTRDWICVGAVIGLSIIAFFLESYSRTYFWNILAYCCACGSKETIGNEINTLNQRKVN